MRPTYNRHSAHDTDDLPAVEPYQAQARRPERAPEPPPKRQRPVAPPPGMVVRQRWRRLRSGAGWTWGGLTALIVCWGIWAIPVRGGGLLTSVIALATVLATGLLVFVLARIVGRALLERTLGRDRPTAWPSHLLAGGFLTLAGITFLQQTPWIRDSGQWLGQGWSAVSDGWEWLIGHWPL